MVSLDAVNLERDRHACTPKSGCTNPEITRSYRAGYQSERVLHRSRRAEVGRRHQLDQRVGERRREIPRLGHEVGIDVDAEVDAVAKREDGHVHAHTLEDDARREDTRKTRTRKIE